MEAECDLTHDVLMIHGVEKGCIGNENAKGVLKMFGNMWDKGHVSIRGSVLINICKIKVKQNIMNSRIIAMIDL